MSNPRRPSYTSSLVTDSVWENQRGTALLGRAKFSARSLLPTDRGPWSDEFGNFSLPRDAIQLPSTEEWRWVGGWMVDMSSGHVDPDGWIYSFNFVGFPWGPSCNYSTYVRKRKWIRRRRFLTVMPAAASKRRASSLPPPVDPTSSLLHVFRLHVSDGSGNLIPPRADRERLETLARLLQVPEMMILLDPNLTPLPLPQNLDSVPSTPTSFSPPSKRPLFSDLLGGESDGQQAQMLIDSLNVLEFDISKVHALMLLIKAYSSNRHWFATQGAELLKFSANRNRILQSINVVNVSSSASSNSDITNPKSPAEDTVTATQTKRTSQPNSP